MAEKLVWVEPPRYRRAALAEAGRLPRYGLLILGGLAFGGALLGLMAWRNMPISGNWPATIAVMLGFFGLMPSLIAWIGTWEGDKITIAREGIGRARIQGDTVIVTSYLWGNIQRCRLGTVAAAGETFPALLADLANGETASFALAEKVALDELRRTLQDRGVELFDAE